MTLFSLILSVVLFVWEFTNLGHDYLHAHPGTNSGGAALLYIRSIFVFVCAPSLWIVQALKYFGMIPHDDLESPDAAQVKMFSWAINAILTGVFLWKIGETVVGFFRKTGP